MQFIPIKDASKLSGISDSTIREKIAANILESKDDDRGKMCVGKREVLSLVPTVLTVFNQKGGCGKTSLAVLLADYYEKKKIKTLLIDFDQQGNMSQTYLKYNDLKESLTLYNYLENKTALAKIIKQYSNYIDIIPSDIKLSRKEGYDIDDLDSMKRDFVPILKKYQIVICDCPPALNSFSKFGLLLSNYSLIPAIPEPYNYDGLFEVLNTIKRLQKYIDDYVDYKIIISAHEQRTIKIHEEYIKLIRDEIKNKVATQSIPNFVGIKERGFQKSNIFDLYVSGKSIEKIKLLLDEIDRFIYEERSLARWKRSLI